MGSAPTVTTKITFLIIGIIVGALIGYGLGYATITPREVTVTSTTTVTYQATASPTPTEKVKLIVIGPWAGAEMEAFQQEMQKKAPLLSEEARAEKQREYQKMVREFRAMQEDAQFEMKEAEKKALKPIFKDLEKVIRQMAQKEGYDLILEKNMPGVYWASPRVDITQKVIQLYNQYRQAQKK